jgi:uncharacterized protein with HEPN domain
MRRPEVYLNDILRSINKVQNYSGDMSFEEFKEKEMVQEKETLKL